MFLAFAGSVFAGTEAPYYTYYGSGAGNGNNVYYNTFIGVGTGHYTTGQYNTFVGFDSGVHNTSGTNNAFLGYHAGTANIDGGYNTFIGVSAGANNIADNNTFLGYQTGNGNIAGTCNTFVGTNTGLKNASGKYNTFVGNAAGLNQVSGDYNTFIGTAAGFGTTTTSGDENIFIGHSAGFGYTSGTGNVVMGYQAGYQATGDYNTIIGWDAGYSNSGSNNVYIGYQAGDGGSFSNKLFIGSLIYGEFDNSIVGIYGKLGVGTRAPVRGLHLAGSNAVFRMDRTADTAAFQIVRTDGSGNPMKVFVVGTNASGPSTGEFVINDNGTALSGPGNRRMTIANDGTVTFTGNVFATAFNPSSLTLKDNVRTYENALDTVNRLRGVSFDWKDSGKPAVGLIAEEVAKVVPEVVAYNDGAAAGVNYASLVGVLVEAVKEQQAQHQAEMKEQLRINEEQQKIISAHSEKIAELERMLMSK
jgi:hypothetical protein